MPSTYKNKIEKLDSLLSRATEALSAATSEVISLRATSSTPENDRASAFLSRIFSRLTPDAKNMFFLDGPEVGLIADVLNAAASPAVPILSEAIDTMMVTLGMEVDSRSVYHTSPERKKYASSSAVSEEQKIIGAYPDSLPEVVMTRRVAKSPPKKEKKEGKKKKGVKSKLTSGGSTQTRLPHSDFTFPPAGSEFRPELHREGQLNLPDPSKWESRIVPLTNKRGKIKSLLKSGAVPLPVKKGKAGVNHKSTKRIARLLKPSSRADEASEWVDM